MAAYDLAENVEAPIVIPAVPSAALLRNDLLSFTVIRGWITLITPMNERYYFIWFRPNPKKMILKSQSQQFFFIPSQIKGLIIKPQTQIGRIATEKRSKICDGLVA